MYYFKGPLLLEIKYGGCHNKNVLNTKYKIEIMTYKYLKNIILPISAFAMLMLASCTKSVKDYTDFTKTTPSVVLLNGGLTNYSSDAYNRGSDTVNLTVTVNLASVTGLSSPLSVTVGVDNAALTAYNASNPQAGFVALPAANFKLLSTALTIPAGQHYATTTLQVYTQGLDPAVSYMTPISILDAGGKPLSSNLNTAYFHTIGNPLAGPYQWTYQRWSGTTDTTTANNGGGFVKIVGVSPLGPTDLGFPESYLNTFVDGSLVMTLDFTNSAGVLSNFTGFLDSKYQTEITDPAGFGGSITTSSSLVGYSLVGNSSTKYAGSTFRYYTAIKNSSGGIRTLIDTFVKQ
jgi:hypothetical protein